MNDASKQLLALALLLMGVLQVDSSAIANQLIGKLGGQSVRLLRTLNQL